MPRSGERGRSSGWRRRLASALRVTVAARGGAVPPFPGALGSLDGRILVGGDGSEPAQRAARRAFDLAPRPGESVTPLPLFPPPPVLSQPAGGFGDPGLGR